MIADRLLSGGRLFATFPKECRQPYRGDAAKGKETYQWECMGS